MAKQEESILVGILKSKEAGEGQKQRLRLDNKNGKERRKTKNSIRKSL